VVFNTGPYTVLPDNSILNTANMQSETGFPSSHQLKSYVASKSPPEIGGARCPVSGCWPSCIPHERAILVVKGDFSYSCAAADKISADLRRRAIPLR